MPHTLPAFFLTLSATWLLNTSAPAAPLEAGVARVDLTPPKEFNAALGGYGDRMSKPAEGVHDRVFAKALVVASDRKRFALVTADVLGFPPVFKPALVERLSGDGWKADQIILVPSHSHSSITWISYILSEEACRRGGYEASVSFYGPTLGRTIVTGALEGTRSLPSSGGTPSR